MIRRFALTFLIAAMALTGCTSSQASPGSQPTGDATEGDESGVASFDQIPDIVDQVRPSVVTISTPRGGVGSGVVYKSNGVIVTNQHVVAVRKGARRVFDQVDVVFATGKKATGRVIGADYRTDLAVIKVDRTGLNAAEFQTKLPEVGELAIAIGSPLGLAESVTAGIVSGLNRNLTAGGGPGGRPLINLIQTDAPISPGSSGGALVNEDAEVIGLNELYIPPERGAVSIGFAIPSATVVNVVQQILRTGEVQHAVFGVGVTEVTPYIARQLGLEQTYGVLVRTVFEGTGAARAGIQPGDVIVAINGDRIRTISGFLAKLRAYAPGDTVTATIIRGGERRQVKVTLTSRANTFRP